jgi:hypothetical protein
MKKHTDNQLMDEAIEVVKRERVYSPAIIYGETVILLQCSTGFWLKGMDEKTYRKTGKHQYEVITDEQAIAGRARWLLMYGTKIKKTAAISNY